MNHQSASRMLPAALTPILLAPTLLGCAVFAVPLAAQTTSGPMTPQPGVSIQQPPPQAKIGVSVALVNTPIIVRDSKGQMVHTLDAKDFRITDNGVQQHILHFDMGGDPLSLVVLVETSSRVDAFLPQIRKAGILITQTVMGSTGEAAVVSFNDSVSKVQDFTTNTDQIETTFDHLQAGTSGSKLFDAMAVGIEMLSGQPLPTADKPGRRRVMLILSEATDVGSDISFGTILRRAQVANVTIYSVGLSTTRAELGATPQDNTPRPTPPGTIGTPPMPGTVQTPDTDAARYGSGDLTKAIVWAVQHVRDKVKGNPLELATAGTGGEHLPTFKDRSIEKAIDDIGGELHSQYSVSYAPTGTNETGYHEIKVAISKKGSSSWRVRSRPGYYVGPPDS